MFAVSRFIKLICIVLLLWTAAEAKEWHGVTPLHSTRADVERLLGTPNAQHGRYAIGNEIGAIFYSKGPCVNGWKVPRDTVIMIAVYYKRSLRISDLKLDLNKFDRVSDALTTNHIYYTNRADGIRYAVVEEGSKNDGLILNAYYESTVADERLLFCREPSNDLGSETETGVGCDLRLP